MAFYSERGFSQKTNSSNSSDSIPFGAESDAEDGHVIVFDIFLLLSCSKLQFLEKG